MGNSYSKDILQIEKSGDIIQVIDNTKKTGALIAYQGPIKKGFSVNSICHLDFINVDVNEDIYVNVKDSLFSYLFCIHSTDSTTITNLNDLTINKINLIPNDSAMCFKIPGINYVGTSNFQVPNVESIFIDGNCQIVSETNNLKYIWLGNNINISSLTLSNALNLEFIGSYGISPMKSLTIDMNSLTKLKQIELNDYETINIIFNSTVKDLIIPNCTNLIANGITQLEHLSCVLNEITESIFPSLTMLGTENEINNYGIWENSNLTTISHSGIITVQNGAFNIRRNEIIDNIEQHGKLAMIDLNNCMIVNNAFNNSLDYETLNYIGIKISACTSLTNSFNWEKLIDSEQPETFNNTIKVLINPEITITDSFKNCNNVELYINTTDETIAKNINDELTEHGLFCDCYYYNSQVLPTNPTFEDSNWSLVGYEILPETTISTHSYVTSTIAKAYAPNCTTIQNEAFYDSSTDSNNTYLTRINCPKCQTIDEIKAFYKCSSLTIAIFPSCQTIGNVAFEYCRKLTTAYFPSCTSIGDATFAECTSLTQANFPLCTSIGIHVFRNCLSLTQANFPLCTSIGDYDFDYCRKLTTANFPLCTSIENSAFADCTSLTLLMISSLLIDSFGDNVFKNIDTSKLNIYIRANKTNALNTKQQINAKYSDITYYYYDSETLPTNPTFDDSNWKKF